MPRLLEVRGEVRGVIRMIVDKPDVVVTAALIPDDCKGQVLIGGSLVKYDAIERAVKFGAKAIVVGGIEDATLRSFLGYDIGVAITGSEKKASTSAISRVRRIGGSERQTDLP